jgi:hypothetical protein
VCIYDGELRPRIRVKERVTFKEREGVRVSINDRVKERVKLRVKGRVKETVRVIDFRIGRLLAVVETNTGPHRAHIWGKTRPRIRVRVKDRVKRVRVKESVRVKEIIRVRLRVCNIQD